MKDVIVYRCGKVVADGVELTHVRAVDPPTHQPKGDEQLGSISLDITGTLTYSPLTYANAPAAAAAAVPVPPHVPSNTIHNMYRNGKINYGSYRELCTVMGVPAPPPPPEPEHPDTTRVRKVIARIENLWDAGELTIARRLELLNAMA